MNSPIDNSLVGETTRDMTHNIIYDIDSPIIQVEQVNAFYLFTFAIKQTPPIEALLGQVFTIAPTNINGETENAYVSVCLFLMPSEFNANYQFLSRQPLNPKWLDKTLTAVNLQLKALKPKTLFTNLPENDKPCVISASENLLGNAFALAKLRQQNSARTVIFLHASSFPFMPKPARFWAPEMPDEAIGASSLLEDWGIINRLASTELLAGCYYGTLSELYQEWADHIEDLNNWQKIDLLAEETSQ